MELKSYKQIELEAARDAAALKFQGVTLAPLYVAGAVAAPTREQSIARMLEDDPAIYERYRAHHNARALINTLRAAGIEIVQR